MSAAEQKLKQVMADVFAVTPESINETASVDTLDKWDSLNHLTLVLALEEAFNVSFTEEQIVEMLNYPLLKAVLEENGVRFD
jgi:acyl carrier protein